MQDALQLAGGSEPLGLWIRATTPPESYADLRAMRFEFSSRGDRVHGRVLLPGDGEGPFPLVLMQHGFGGSSRAPYLDATGGPWARRGVAVASIDLPLHGARADQKLAAFISPDVQGAAAEALRIEFARQAVVDLQRALDALARLDAVDVGRCGFAGFSLGAMVGAAFCGLDPRPRAAALALGGAGLGPRSADPARYVGRIAPRPVLFVNSNRDATIPREAALAFFAAAGEPREQRWFDADHETLPGAALKAMWEFLSPHLSADG
jgi:dienelactone hydrolase